MFIDRLTSCVFLEWQNEYDKLDANPKHEKYMMGGVIPTSFQLLLSKAIFFQVYVIIKMDYNQNFTLSSL